MSRELITSSVSFYAVIRALEGFADSYPVDRLSEYQITQIEAVCRKLRQRLQEAKEPER
jgi:hypothetical protein